MFVAVHYFNRRTTWKSSLKVGRPGLYSHSLRKYFDRFLAWTFSFVATCPITCLCSQNVMFRFSYICCALNLLQSDGFWKKSTLVAAFGFHDYFDVLKYKYKINFVLKNILLHDVHPYTCHTFHSLLVIVSTYGFVEDDKCGQNFEL